MNITEAIAVLDKIEYSSDGDLKRYPNAPDYEKAMEVVKKYVQHAQHHLPTSAVLGSLLDIDGDL